MLVRIATRASPLARWQAEHVAAALEALDSEVRTELVLVETVADRRLEVPIWAMGGKGVFVKEIQAALLDGRADVAVHSAKDLPARTPDELVLVAVPPRADPRDLLVGARLDDLAPGALVATGSVRRRAQLAWRRPDLTFTGLRGNIATRLARLAEGAADAILMAAAAVERLEVDVGIHEVLDPSVMVPQVGQGALAIECRVPGALSGAPPDVDTAIGALVEQLEDPAARRCVDAERAFLDELGGDCDLPAGAHAVLADAAGGDDDGVVSLTVTGVLASLDGHMVARRSAHGTDGPALGRAVASELRAAHPA